MKHIFIVNPKAGKKNQDQLIENIKKVFKDTDFFIEYTSAEKDATAIARRYAKSGIELCIYACGGDGTVNEIINGIYGYKNTSLGIIPIGTGNDFIKAFSSEYEKSDFLKVENYLNPIHRSCDLMDVNGNLSLNTTSIGFDVRVAANVGKYKRLPFLKNKSDSLPYILSLLTSLLRTLGFKMNVVLDGKTLGKDEYSFVVASNGNYYGGGFLPCPDAKIDDGYIDVCLIKKLTHMQIAKFIGSYKKGTHVKVEELVSMHRVKSLHIISEDEVELCLDGEILKCLNPRIEIIPAAITLCLPRK